MEINRRNDFEWSNAYDERVLYDAVLIIGNGFDLHFGLETSYTHFVKSSIFMDLLANNRFANHLREKHDLQNWIDVENELSVYSRLITGFDDKFYFEYQELTKALVQYLRNIRYSRIDKSKIGFELIEMLCNYSTLILDFNYTKTIENILSEINDLKTASITHVKVHGDLENGVVFGVDDKAKIGTDHIFLKKSVNSNFKSTNFSQAIIDSTSFGVFGHSLGETDHMYFREYFQTACKGKSEEDSNDLAFYYFKEDGRLKLHKHLDILTKQQIAKLKQKNKIRFIDTSK